MLTKIKSFVNSTDVPQIDETAPTENQLKNAKYWIFSPISIPVLVKQISELEKFGGFC